MRLILLGSGAFALPSFEALSQTHQVVAVVTQPDKPAGRKQTLTATPVGQWAMERGLPLHKVEQASDPAFVGEVASLKAQASVVIAFGQKLSPELIAALGSPVVNLHASLLPKFRGAGPIQRAMMAGETVTGNCVIALSQRMDAGEIYARQETAIDPLETAGELHDRLAMMGPSLLLSVLRRALSGALRGEAQDESQATKAPKLSKREGVVHFALPAPRVRAHIHGVTPWPGAQTMLAGQRLLLRRVRDWPDEPPGDTPHGDEPGTLRADGKVACARGVVELLEVQPEGGKVMPFEAYARGRRLASGLRLTPPADA